MSSPNQFSLLKQKRFAPFFFTQFSGAFNDNPFKFALTILLTYHIQVEWLPSASVGLLIGALFIAPFLLFSATSGQLSDKYNSATIMRFVKNLEIVIMVIAAIGFFTNQIALLLACIFLMGCHSTLFGPVKYAYLPQVLKKEEITGGNGMVEMGTFMAILLGNLTGGILVTLPHIAHATVAVSCLGIAILGRVFAGFVPNTSPAVPQLKINWNLFSETYHNLVIAYQNRLVFYTLLAISWMWLFGGIFLSQFPSFAKDVLHAGPAVASLLLFVFSLGIAIGSLLCEKLSRGQVEIGLSPIGAIGMTIFSLDLYFACQAIPPNDNLSIAGFMVYHENWRVLVDLFFLAFSAGLYSVPMYALIQTECLPTHRARIIAANNILNAVFIILSSLVAVWLLHQGRTIPDIFFVCAIGNIVVNCVLFWIMPSYWRRFLAWIQYRT